MIPYNQQLEKEKLEASDLVAGQNITLDKVGKTVTINATGGTGNGVPIGAVMPYAGDVEPEGYMKCLGQDLSTENYPELFSVIKYTYGGEGTTFYLPDLRMRVPMGWFPGETPYGTKGNLGTMGGEETVTLTVKEMPSHTHIQNSHNHTQSAHSHGLNSHTHSVPAHSHGLNSHTHSLNSHTHSIPTLSGTAASSTHYHKLTGRTTTYGQGSQSSWRCLSFTGTNSDYSQTVYTEGVTDSSKAYGGSHTHSVTTTASTTGAASGSTGAATGSTANSSALTSGAATGNTANSTATNNATTAINQTTGGGEEHNNMQPYIVLNYIIKVTN